MSTTVIGEVDRNPKAPEISADVHASAIEPRAKFGLSVSKSWTHPVTGSTRQSTSHFEVRCRGELAENVIASVREGDHVIITGEIEQRPWKSPDGRSTRTFLMADDVGLALSFHRIDAPQEDEEDPDT